MTSSLIAGLGGLRSHQSWLDVIGNNLANSNTPGFKSSRALFGDLISRTLRPATPSTGSIGGTNPSQIGLGVGVAGVDRFFGQGALNLTGRTFDLALVGRGFFALDSGTSTQYSRVGSFGLDASNNLVDLGSGYRVLDNTGSPLSIDTEAVQPPQATSSLIFGGNLPAEVTGPLAEVLSSSSTLVEGTAATLAGSVSGALNIPNGEAWTLDVEVDGGPPQTVSITGTGAPVTMADVAAAIDGLSGVTATVVGGAVQVTSEKKGLNSSLVVTPGDVGAGTDLASAVGLATNLVAGTEAPATSATDLSQLTINTAAYADGDTIVVSGTGTDGTSVQSTFTYGAGGDGTTIADLVAFVDGQFGDATAAFNDTTGQLTLTSDAPGEASLSLVLGDGASQTGSTDWALNAMSTTTNGTGPDTMTTSVEVWDSSGVARLMTMEYERQEDGTWNLSTSLDPSEGTVVQGAVTGITFGSNGELLTPTTGTVTVQFNGQPQQDVSLDLGTVGGFEGLTQFGGSGSVKIESQDGYGAGTLASLSVTAEGMIQGFFTNGQISDMGQLGIATFANDEGLEDLGNNFWGETANSGVRTLGTGLFAGSGEVVGGALEQSNVDTTEQFVHLIQAQRGFQASARIITTQDQLLEEIVNIV